MRLPGLRAPRARVLRLVSVALVACGLNAGTARLAAGQTSMPERRHAWGASLGASAGHSDSDENSPRGLQLYSNVGLWRNLSARRALGLDYGTLGGRDVDRLITFYSQSGASLTPLEDARRMRDRIDRLAVVFRWRDPGRGAGVPFTLLGAGYYYDRMRLDDVVSAPSDSTIPIQRLSTRRTSRWFGVMVGEGVTWKAGPVGVGAAGRAEWAFSPKRLWVSGGLAFSWR